MVVKIMHFISHKMVIQHFLLYAFPDIYTWFIVQQIKSMPTSMQTTLLKMFSSATPV